MQPEKTVAEQIYAKLNLMVLAKDTGSRYTFANEAVMQWLGTDSPQQIVGKKDSDLYWRKYADMFVTGDNIAMSNRPYVNVLEPLMGPSQSESICHSRMLLAGIQSK
jgi:hypothetical protein